MKDPWYIATEEFVKFAEKSVGKGPDTNVWGRSSEFQQELEELGIDCLKVMKEEIKSNTSNDHERLYAVSAAFQRVMESLPNREV